MRQSTAGWAEVPARPPCRMIRETRAMRGGMTVGEALDVVTHGSGR
ncbi:hypothetical protein GZL_00556 [Streptomyces sp. 769]|nr:hypothetical protein GZL_00556 [Streptomyces sp. 769]